MIESSRVAFRDNRMLDIGDLVEVNWRPMLVREVVSETEIRVVPYGLTGLLLTDALRFWRFLEFARRFR